MKKPILICAICVICCIGMLFLFVLLVPRIFGLSDALSRGPRSSVVTDEDMLVGDYMFVGLGDCRNLRILSDGYYTCECRLPVGDWVSVTGKWSLVMDGRVSFSYMYSRFDDEFHGCSRPAYNTDSGGITIQDMDGYFSKSQ